MFLEQLWCKKCCMISNLLCFSCSKPWRTPPFCYKKAGMREWGGGEGIVLPLSKLLSFSQPSSPGRKSRWLSPVHICCLPSLIWASPLHSCLFKLERDSLCAPVSLVQKIPWEERGIDWGKTLSWCVPQTLSPKMFHNPSWEGWWLGAPQRKVISWTRCNMIYSDSLRYQTLFTHLVQV